MSTTSLPFYGFCYCLYFGKYLELNSVLNISSWKLTVHRNNTTSSCPFDYIKSHINHQTGSLSERISFKKALHCNPYEEAFKAANQPCQVSFGTWYSFHC
jgi:hypothetical protein